MRNLIDWVFFAFYIVGNGLGLAFFLILFAAGLHQIYKKTRMKFEKKENEGATAGNSEGS